MKAKKIRILSIDGGGIRGILPGVVLERLESKLNELSDGQINKIANAFDLVAGTSTGGILTCAYLMPHKSTPASPKFTAQQAVNLYLERGDEIFDVNLKQKLKSSWGLTDEKYNAKKLEKALLDSFENTMLSERLKPCVITAYDISNRNAFFFGQHRAKKGDINNFLVREVARATSAAPTYFETFLIKNAIGSPYPLIDGGVFANNPTLCAYSEARTMTFPGRVSKPTAKDMLIVSVGTGSVRKPYSYESATGWGKLGWLQPVIDIMMSGSSETVHHHLRQIYDTLNPANKTNYHRLEPPLSADTNSDMDDASDENLKALEGDAKNFISTPSIDKELTQIAQKLIKYN